MSKMIPGLDVEEIEVTNRGRAPKRCGGMTLEPGKTYTVPVAFVDQFAWDKELYFDYTPYSDQLQSRTQTGALKFDWWCPLSMVDGYGRHALAIYKGFRILGAEPVLKDVGWIDRAYFPSELDYERYKGLYAPPSKIGAVMSLPYDDHIHNHQSVHKIVVTQFETDHIPEAHIRKVNLCHHLIVTSKYQPKVWKKSGCMIPISIMTPGVDTDYFSFKERTSNGLFKVLLLGAVTGRKNPLGAIRIFQTASQGRHDWRLTIKTRRTDTVRQIYKAAERDPRITIDMGESHPDAVLNYYHTHDCFLWPSKGEGVGLPPLEAMSTGMEVVCSDNSGMSDFVDDNHCYPIKTAHMESAASLIKGDGFGPDYIKMFGDVGQWWVPDEQHAIRQLEKCFDAWLEGKGKGRKAAEYVRNSHSLLHQSSSILKVLEKYE